MSQRFSRKAMPHKESRKTGDIPRDFLFIFIPLLILVTGVMILVHYPNAKAQRKAIEDNQVVSTKLLAKAVGTDIHEVVSDLVILSELKLMQSLLEGGRAADPAPVAESFLSWSKNKHIYDQIRYIDENGMEIIRVNLESGSPRIVPKEELQSKKSRYYFTESFALEQGEVYISQFDLNIEHGQIEQPLKPMIRLAMPVFDSNNRKKGVLVLNYLGANLIHSFERMSVNVLGDVMLLNSDGYWLKGREQKDEWAFMYQDRIHRTFKNALPQVWRQIQQEDLGQTFSKHGLCTFITVYPIREGRKATTLTDELHWKIVCCVPSGMLPTVLGSFASEHLPSLGILTIVLAIVCWVLATTRVKHRRAEEALRQSYEVLKELETLRDNLTHMIVHDMRSPLMGISGYLELLKLKASENLDEKEKEYLQRAATQTSQLVEMVSSLLDVSKMEEGEMSLTPTDCDTAELFRETADTLGSVAANNDVSLETTTESIRIACDKDIIHRVITNLVSNAIRVTPKGGQIRMQAEKQAEQVKITITDTGPGIPPEFHEKIFEKFGQVDPGGPSHKFSTGLGLTFCKLAVETHGGTIGLNSEVGKGTAFWFVLPCGESE